MAAVAHSQAPAAQHTSAPKEPVPQQQTPVPANGASKEPVPQQQGAAAANGPGKGPVPHLGSKVLLQGGHSGGARPLLSFQDEIDEGEEEEMQHR